MTHVSDKAWLHVKDLRYFLHLGANPHEAKIGQNIKVDVSFLMPYLGTQDQLGRTIDYSLMVKKLGDWITELSPVQLLEFLAERLLDKLGEEFPLSGAKISITKGYAPIDNFTGVVTFEAERKYRD